MFRVKPYTKCLDCLTQDKIRCQNCMELIIEDIAKKTSPKKVRPGRKIAPISHSQHLQESQPKRQIKTSCSSQKLQTHGAGRTLYGRENGQKLMITSKYNWWLSEKQRKRNESPDMAATLNKNWPRKTRAHDYNLEKLGAKQPKFEKWEKKLLDQLLSKTNRLR